MEYYVSHVYKYLQNTVQSFFAYIGDSDDASIMLGIEVGQEDSSRIFFRLGGTNLVAFADRILEIKKANVNGVLYVHGQPLIIENPFFPQLLRI